MHLKMIILAATAIVVAPGLYAQDIGNYTNFTIFGKKVQIHGFLSEGYVKSDDNNWLTMQTAH